MCIMENIKIRDVQIEDASRLVEIYSYYVLNTAVSFEYAVPTVEEFDRWYDLKWFQK